jgi:hypothetical protein
MKKNMLQACFCSMVLLAGCTDSAYEEVSNDALVDQAQAVSGANARVALLAPTKYITQVFTYAPAPGQFINTLPAYVAGNTAANMAAKVATSLVGKTNGLVCLGGFGGYIVVGFDHTIANVASARDFKVYGNAFANWSEPGVVMVSKDVNANGLPDDAWYELAGSNYNTATTIKNYQITYTKPSPLNADVPWTDNQGGSGVVKRNTYHTQASYYPQWEGNSITFTGTKLANHAYDSDPSATEYWLAPAFAWGYADNVPNADANATFDIAWAVNSSGVSVSLTGIDFIKIYTASNQDCGWLGEISTEIAGIEDINI